MTARDRGRMARLKIGTRLVVAVTAAMGLVLSMAAAFVFWRVQHALDVQLDQDLDAYQRTVLEAVRSGEPLPRGTPGEYYQLYDASGRLLRQSDPAPTAMLVTAAQVAEAVDGHPAEFDVGSMIPASEHPYRVRITSSRSPRGPIAAVTAISRSHRDEALRELLLQLALTDLLALVAASLVGYWTARAALNPVERYRRAAEEAGEQHGARLPVPLDRDDELTRLGHTLNDLLDRLEASSEREHRFITDASHELRTPLSLLSAEVEYAMHRPRSAEELTTVLRSVGGQVDRLIALANELLDLEQVATGQRLDVRSVGVRSLVDGVVARYEAPLAAAGRLIRITCVDTPMAMDPRWMDLALGNLVENALRHGAGAVRLDVRTSNSQLVMLVHDEGPGFPAGFASRAFDRFSRADESRSSRGSGLGLAVVATVAAAHGGTARLASELAPSAVEIRIPVVADRPDDRSNVAIRHSAT